MIMAGVLVLASYLFPNFGLWFQCASLSSPQPFSVTCSTLFHIPKGRLVPVRGTQSNTASRCLLPPSWRVISRVSWYQCLPVILLGPWLLLISSWIFFPPSTQSWGTPDLSLVSPPWSPSLPSPPFLSSPIPSLFLDGSSRSMPVNIPTDHHVLYGFWTPETHPLSTWHLNLCAEKFQAELVWSKISHAPNPLSNLPSPNLLIPDQ